MQKLTLLLGTINEMHRMSLNKLPFFIFVLFQACSSDLKRAEKLLSEKSPHEALPIFEKVLAKDPGNEKALQGVRKSKIEVLSQDLISVRMLRLAKNSEAQIQVLESYLSKEKNWGALEQSAALAQTKNEEITEAIKILFREVETEIAAKRSLPALAKILFHKNIWNSRKTEATSDLYQRALLLGQAGCTTLQRSWKSKADFYLEKFQSTYCAIFDQVHHIKLSDSLPAELGGNLEVAFLNAKLESDLGIQLQKILENAYKKSPFYEGPSTSIPNLRLLGSYTEQHSFEFLQKTHHYEEKQFFKRMEPTTRTRTYKKTAVTKKWSDSLKQIIEVNEPFDVTESFVESVEVDDFKMVAKNYHYQSLLKEQKLSFQVTGDFWTDSSSEERKLLKFQESIFEVGEEHQVNLPSIGLTPKESLLTNSNQWKIQKLEELEKTFHSSLTSLWQKRYCPDEKLISDEGMMRCERLFQNDDNFNTAPPQLNAWFEKNFHVSYETFKKILELKFKNTQTIADSK